MNNASTAVALTQAPSIVREYYELTKPGITQMVAMTTVTGYYLAIPTDVATYASSPQHWINFLATTIGAVLISGGSCVFNHVMERDSDALMKRTASRPLPTGSITPVAALMFGTVISVLGAVLLATTNMLTFMLALATWLSYVVVYTPLKSRTSFAMLIGGLPGALPFAGGWVAVRGEFDAMALALFAILFFWQMPHFLALGWMYRTDYLAGGLALRALHDHTGATASWQMIMYSIALIGALIVPTIIGTTGIVYGIGSVALGLWLVVETIQFRSRRTVPAARRVLLTSYAVLMGALVLMVIDKASI